jgi:tRNA-2-methylthio-N6-dimethylallyladenosine synthase
MVTVQISYAAPHHLVADGPVLGLRPTRAGDAWHARQAAGGGQGAATGEPRPVLIGMPAVPVRG